MSITLRPIQDTDIDMIHGWLNQDFIRKWFGEAEDWLKELHGRKGEYSFMKHFIVMLNNSTIGFCQYFDCSKTDCDEVWENEPANTFGIGYLIANKNMLGKGYSKQIINSLCDKAKQEAGAEQIIADLAVDEGKENIASIKALESCGFVYDSKTTLYKKQV